MKALDEIKVLSGVPLTEAKKVLARAATDDEVAELRQYVQQVAGKNYSVSKPKAGSLKNFTAVRAKNGSFVNGRVAAAKIAKWLIAHGWVQFPSATIDSFESTLRRLKTQIGSDPDGYEDFTSLMKADAPAKSPTNYAKVTNADIRAFKKKIAGHAKGPDFDCSRFMTDLGPLLVQVQVAYHELKRSVEDPDGDFEAGISKLRDAINRAYKEV